MRDGITVVIPSALRKAPDGDLWLQRALTSVAEQTLRPREVVIGVHENVPDLWKDADNYTPWRFVTCPDRSPAHNVNAAAKLVETEFMAILEDDDQWATDHLRVMSDNLQHVNADIVTTSQIERRFDGHLVRVLHFPTSSAWLMKTACWRAIGGADTSYHPHWDNGVLGAITAAGLKRVHVIPPEAVGDLQLNHLLACGAYVHVGTKAYTVNRMHNPSGILANEASGRRSQEEYGRLTEKYGRIPW